MIDAQTITFWRAYRQFTQQGDIDIDMFLGLRAESYDPETCLEDFIALQNEAERRRYARNLDAEKIEKEADTMVD